MMLSLLSFVSTIIIMQYEELDFVCMQVLMLLSISNLGLSALWS